MNIMKYPIKPKSANPILTVLGDLLTLQEISDIFCSPISDQLQLCKRLGIDLKEDSINIRIEENKNTYHILNKYETNQYDKESICSIELNFAVVNCEKKFPLPFSINFNQFKNKYLVNFLGEIVFKNSSNIDISIPLVGRGTVSLEGRNNDLHLPCIDGHIASFQQKMAIIFSILAYFNLNRDDVEILRAHLLKICEKYYGATDMLNYICDKAFSITAMSFFEYMKLKYSTEDEENVPIMLQHFIEFCEPDPTYFEHLKEIFTEEELHKELRDTSSDPSGPDKNPISPKVREIINTFIFLDEIYMIKPYPGENFRVSEKMEISIYDVANQFNNGSLESIKSILAKLGLLIQNENIKLRFSEKGKKYIFENNKNKIEDEESEESFEFNFELLSQCEDLLRNIKIILDQNPIDNVNFFGKIDINTGFFSKITVPLLGRGTVSLDGSLDKINAGFSTRSKTASFQQRVAILYSALVVLKIKVKDLQKFESFIRKLNKMYHGLDDIIEYTFLVTKQKENETFFQYMKKIHMDYSKMPITLKTMLTYNRFPSKYYEGLISQYTEKELIDEKERLRSIRLSSIIPKFVRKINYMLTKVNIF